jgi:hypothetical protein
MRRDPENSLEYPKDAANFAAGIQLADAAKPYILTGGANDIEFDAVL